MRILNQVQQPDADPAELAKLISLEPSLTAAVLRVANSAAYRALGRIDSVRDAITRREIRGSLEAALKVLRGWQHIPAVITHTGHDVST